MSRLSTLPMMMQHRGGIGGRRGVKTGAAPPPHHLGLKEFKLPHSREAGGRKGGHPVVRFGVREACPSPIFENLPGDAICGQGGPRVGP